jgi:hypothetical protein
MKVVRSRGAGPKIELVIQANAPVPRAFEVLDLGYPADSVYLATDKGECRRSGSYYTPDHIVNRIVETALGAACRDLYERLKREITETEAAIDGAEDAERPSLEARLQKLDGDFDHRVLALKVLDPSMGSGHFLIRSCQYLAEEIVTNPYTSDPFAEGIHAEESTITYWKRRVAESCLYGVDTNPMAVELAKLALWLETVASDAALIFLDHHLRCGDSIIGARVQRLDSLRRRRVC